MESYIITEKFTLVPKHLYQDSCLREIFNISTTESIRNLYIEKYDAILAFALPKEAPDGTKPLIYNLLKYAETLNEHNKVVINYNRRKKLTHIVAIEGEKLLLANTYHTSDTMSLLYFITLATQQVMFNPQLTKIHIYGEMEQDGIRLIDNFFCGTVLNAN